MLRRIIEIDSEKCNGCGLCVTACHEGAIGMVNGKAQLLRDDYCDGLGDCLPSCPVDAIHFVEREALAYDEEAVNENMKKNTLPCGCPGTHAKTIERKEKPVVEAKCEGNASELRQWPVQIKLIPVKAPYLNGAHLLIAADCAAYAHGNFHNEFMKDKITIIGCPKLDEGDYSEKLTAILESNDIKSVTIVRMEVPCCGGLSNASVQALKDCGKMIPWSVVVVGTDGSVVS